MLQPLTGFSVGITADRRWDEQAALFERRGATVVHGPSIRTLPWGAEAPLREATEEVIAHPPAVLVANTGLGIRSWFAHADSWGLGPALEAALGRARIYARGPKASGALHSTGLAVVARARSERLQEVVDLVIREVEPGQRVLVQVDGSGDSAELQRLRHAGAEVLAIPVYRWTLPTDLAPALRLVEGLVNGRLHAVTFTSGPALRNLVAIAAGEGADHDLRAALTDGRAVVGCVGPVCADAAVSEGLLSPHLVQPDAYRLGPLVRAVGERLSARRVTVQVGPVTMVLSGHSVMVAGEIAVLTDTESRLLATLAERPGAVFGKERLLRTVWAGEVSDPHTVEVAVARLRKRLGTHGAMIRSVHRRGYTLRA